MFKEPKDLSNTYITDYIHLIRGVRVMLDEELADLYEVPTKYLNLQVRRNIERFPKDFMFRLTVIEADSLRLQIATLKKGRGEHRKYLPIAFTEQGIAMLSSVLNSPRAIQVNIHIMRAFVAMRRYALTHEALAKKIDELEGKYDKQFAVVFDALRILTAPPARSGRKIGFLSEGKAPYVLFN